MRSSQACTRPSTAGSRHFAGLLGAVALLAGAAPAPAATIAVTDEAVVFTAAPGEANVVTVRHRHGAGAPGAFGVLTITDGGAPLTTGTGCAQRSARSVECAGGQPELIAHLGDRDDALALVEERDAEASRYFRLRVFAGPGDDRLTGAATAAAQWVGEEGDDVIDATGVDLGAFIIAASNTLIGGPGADRLVGTEGDDGLVGGSGADVVDGRGGDDYLDASDADHPVAAGSVSPDLLIGGDGSDRVIYETHPHPVLVDLGDAEPDGAAGEGDRLTGLEHAEGSAGDDVLAGDDGPNRLTGGGGLDRLAGRGGDDILTTGSSTGLRSPRPRSPDEFGDERVACGDGYDRLDHGTGLRDFLTRDCERVATYWRSEPKVFPLAPAASGRLRFRVRCPRIDPRYERCGATVTAGRPDDRDRIVAYGRTVAMPRRELAVEAALTRLGRRLTARRGGVKVALVIRTRLLGGSPRPDVRRVAWTTRLAVAG